MKIMAACMAALCATSANAEELYMTFNATKLWTAPQAFERAYVSGNVTKAPQDTKDGDKVLVPIVTAQPAATAGKLIIETSMVAPGSYLIARRQILLLDVEDTVVAELTVIVTPTGAPMRDLDILRDGRRQYFLCGHDPVRNSEDCIGAVRPKDVTAETVTSRPDGSVSRRREY
jgi:hypothetical protein